MRQYARTQTANLLRRLALQVNRAARDGGADSVHDLRVVIRRLSRCLRVFSQFYPPHSWKRIRRRLSGLMAAAAAVRDRDIAVELLGQAGVSPQAAVVVQLVEQRREAGRRLLLEIRRWKSRGFSRKWRSRLEL